MTTKAFQRFNARVVAYDSDLELSGVLIGRFINMANSRDSIGSALGAAMDTHPIIHSRINTRNSRNVLGLHFKKTIYAAFIKDLYEDFADYVSSSLSRAALAGIDPARFVGEIKLDLHAVEIIAAGSWENVVRLMSDKIFRALENERSTIVLINKISRRLGLNLDNQILNAAMPYLDARHILVHRDGLADEIYRNQYPQVPLQGERIILNFALVSAARTNVRALARHIDDQLIAMGLVRPQDIVGGAAARAPVA
jgi:hypothetical protein